MTTSTATSTIVTSRDGVTYSTKRKNVNAAIVCWNWNGTERSVAWTTKGREGVRAAVANLANRDDVEIFYL